MVAPNSELLRHRLRHRLGVAGDHHNLEAHLLQPADRLSRTVSHSVGQGDYGEHTGLIHQHDHALAASGSFAESSLRRLAHTHSPFLCPLPTAPAAEGAIQPSLYPLAGDGAEVCDRQTTASAALSLLDH